MRIESLTRSSVGRDGGLARRSEPDGSDRPSACDQRVADELRRRDAAGLRPLEQRGLQAAHVDADDLVTRVPYPRPPDMRSVSDNGATAPISALTNAFIFLDDRSLRDDHFSRKISAALLSPDFDRVLTSFAGSPS